MQIFALLFVPFILLFLWNINIVYVTRRGFGFSLPVTLLSVTLIMYFSQMLIKSFEPGIILLVVLALVGGLLFVFRLFREKDRTFLGDIFSKGFYAFVIIYLIIFFVDFGRHFTAWDEVGHWGVMVKEMLRTGKFYADEASRLKVHPEYPPFASLFELLVCRLSGGYSEGAVSFALHFFLYSLLIPPVTEELKLDSLSPVFLIFSVMALFVIFDADYVYPTIYTDFFLAALFVYGMLLIISKEALNSRVGYVALLLNTFCLIITKQMGISFVLLAAFAYLLYGILDKDKGKRIVLLRTAGIILAAAISYIIWNGYVKSKGVTGQQFDLSQISIKGFVSILTGGGSWVQHMAFLKYVTAIFSLPVSTGLLKLSYFVFTIIAVLFICVMWRKYTEIFPEEDFKVVLATTLIGAAGYAFAMLVLYMFCYSEGEMSSLASFARYMDTYIVSVYLLLLFVGLRIMNRAIDGGIKNMHLAVICALLLVLMPSERMSDLTPQILKGNGNAEYEELAEYLDARIEDGAEVYLMSTSNQMYSNFMRYMSEKAVIEDEEINEEAVALISQKDYVYVINTNDFINDCLKAYIDGGEVTPHTVYRVLAKGNSLSLNAID